MKGTMIEFFGLFMCAAVEFAFPFFICDGAITLEPARVMKPLATLTFDPVTLSNDPDLVAVDGFE